MKKDYYEAIYVADLLKQKINKINNAVDLCITAHSGKEEDRFIALTERFYRKNPNGELRNCKGFIAYVDFRLKEVRYKRKSENLPVLSSIEIRGDGYGHFDPELKFHFDRERFLQEIPVEKSGFDESLEEGSLKEREAIVEAVLARVAAILLGKVYE